MDTEEFFNRIDLSALSPDEQNEFETWLEERPNMKVSISTALRKGQLVNACLLYHRRRSEYSVRIE